jgi:hypothetical protein
MTNVERFFGSCIVFIFFRSFTGFMLTSHNTQYFMVHTITSEMIMYLMQFREVLQRPSPIPSICMAPQLIWTLSLSLASFPHQNYNTTLKSRAKWTTITTNPSGR